ncbi:YciI family protein [Actinomadura sp. HBU206391]|uniref:YciI family protein n=1 Tax=Actinomadura sp. HBU206391 TaxID=2731692 RepID=UPI00165038AA|nr:YciI family protein [Actinomadura sp. HBU206391]MBC6457382.1 YciI family protein [Actinomadura sp. HBU206391]
MKYMLLIYNNPESLAAQDIDGLMREVDVLMGELAESGEWVGGEALAEPAHTRTVRVRDGVPATTDGPFAEAKEQLAGYCVVECETLERATEIAARWPDARYGAMEVRPILDTGDVGS